VPPAALDLAALDLAQTLDLAALGPAPLASVAAVREGERLAQTLTPPLAPPLASPLTQTLAQTLAQTLTSPLTPRQHSTMSEQPPGGTRVCSPAGLQQRSADERRAPPGRLGAPVRRCCDNAAAVATVRSRVAGGCQGGQMSCGYGAVHRW
jgi:hypothetical protein